jgi:hypothetical protein
MRRWLRERALSRSREEVGLPARPMREARVPLALSEAQVRGGAPFPPAESGWLEILLAAFVVVPQLRCCQRPAGFSQAPNKQVSRVQVLPEGNEVQHVLPVRCYQSGVYKWNPPSCCSVQ